MKFIVLLPAWHCQSRHSNTSTHNVAIN